ncbi:MULTISPECIES: ABC transporter permease [Halanaerobium]|jgi:peptide/nickel transport system permease protein|uniref:Peptide/nickel transport system permease protein n=1 Tax=Halanaerobium kushneri TaxID=56779 RepID=A0A1N6QNA2_9FIRM|nr:MULTISPECIES: ABC transporter permease [Halanaerobium]PUU94163.1 MAG: peptide/nickel transport system permease protein [Halanaerobium sp.]RCW61017.1 peptide/nickel transport system permease protein [Halanaerobium sp. ST460_2HS_T2]SIQ17972.1 peptide/nickel transport system permease protein [Halanaerobium kushneri]
MAKDFWAKHENLYYALTNKKVIFGLTIVAFVFLLAAFGPMIAQYEYDEYAGQGYLPPSSEHFFGTTIDGKDVFTRTVNGLRSTLLVGAIAGSIATLIGCIIGFVAGYYGGTIFDELLMMLTNIFVVMPQLALLIVIAAFLEVRGTFVMAVIVASTAWPWTARAVRSQTLSLKNQEYVSLSRISSISVGRILREDIASNMFSYVFMVFIQQFNGTMLATVQLEFLGLGPTKGISLGLVMQNAVNWNGIQLGMWWWAIIPGLILTILITALYFINTGLDAAFNPRLREM